MKNRTMVSEQLNPLPLLPQNVASKIFSKLQCQDLCYAARTCIDFRRYVSTVETLDVPVPIGKVQAKSLAHFLTKHAFNDGMQVGHLFVCICKLENVASLQMSQQHDS